MGTDVVGQKQKLLEVAKKLGENDRKEAKSYVSPNADVYFAKIVNPKSGRIQYRIELKMIGEFKPFVTIKSSAHFNELKKFIQWLEQHKGYLDALDELNGSVTVRTSEDVEDF